MRISITDPIGNSFNRMKLVLFNGCNIKKWFVLGFCSFLAGLGGNGSVFLSAFNGPFDNNKISQLSFDGILQFILERLTLVIIGGLLITLVIIGIWVLFLWLSSRGKFMFFDGVIRDQAAVSEPWHQFRFLGNNLFQFRLYLIFFCCFVMLIIIMACLLIAWPDISMKRLGTKTIIVSGLGISVSLLLSLSFVLINQVLTDFVLPIMYRRNIRTLVAIKVFWKEILPNYIMPFILFYLMKVLLVIAAGIIILIAGCLTCCIMFCITSLPYVASVILLPVATFFRCYSIFFLEQFGEEWSFFKTVESQNPVLSL